MQSDDGARLTGRLLDGRYRIGARIARGGMASVYEATDTRLDRQVAVKVMHPGLGDDDEFAARFVREARHAARLSHPHVVGVSDQGDDDGTVFLVMEYVPGHTLRDVIRKEAPMAPERRWADRTHPVRARRRPPRPADPPRHQARERPDRRRGDPVRRPGQGRRLRPGQGGHHRHPAHRHRRRADRHGVYLAPSAGRGSRADERADVYAVGVVLYEMLTGRKAARG